MNSNIKTSIGIISYIISLILIGYYLILEFSLLNLTSPIERIKIILVIITLMYLGSLLLIGEKNNVFQKLPQINMWVWFILYIIMILNLTLFDQYFGRTGIAMISNNSEQFKEYLEYNFNIIPFATIKNYILALKNNNLTNSTFIYNIFGNLLAFAPLSFFLPQLFKSMDKWYKFFIITSIFIIFIETMQMITMSGSFDIDDYILNIIGAIILYIIINNKRIKNHIDNFIYLRYKIKD